MKRRGLRKEKEEGLEGGREEDLEEGGREEDFEGEEFGRKRKVRQGKIDELKEEKGGVG